MRSPVGAVVKATTPTAVVGALACRACAAVATLLAARAAPLAVVLPGSGNVPVLLDVGVDVAGIPEVAHALDLNLCWSPAVDGHVLYGRALDRGPAPGGVHPDLRALWATAMLTF